MIGKQPLSRSFPILRRILRRHRPVAVFGGRFDEVGQDAGQGLALGHAVELTGPEHDHAPAHGFQFGDILAVALAVALDFRPPPFGAGLGNARFLAARVPVPEAAVDEDYRVVSRQNDIRLAGELAVFRPVDGEAVAEPMQQRTHE